MSYINKVYTYFSWFRLERGPITFVKTRAAKTMRHVSLSNLKKKKERKKDKDIYHYQIKKKRKKENDMHHYESVLFNFLSSEKVWRPAINTIGLLFFFLSN